MGIEFTRDELDLIRSAVSVGVGKMPIGQEIVRKITEHCSTDAALPAADPVREAATELVQKLCAIRSFEIEAGCSGEGPLVKLIKALGKPIPTSLQEWLKEGDEEAGDDDFGVCDQCGEHHPEGVLEEGLCPACSDL